MRLLLSFLLLALPAGAQPPLADVDRPLEFIENNMDVRAMATDPRGDIYVAGVAPGSFARAGARITRGRLDKADIFVARLDASGERLLWASAVGGSEDDIVEAMHIDAGGVYLTGWTLSPDFPVTSALQPGAAFGGFILKLRPSGDAVVYSAVAGTRILPSSIDVDSSGAAFVGGSAGARALPSTPGVMRPSPLPDVHPDDMLGFLMKLDPTGARAVFATYMGPVGGAVTGVSVRPGGETILLGDSFLAAVNGSASGQRFLTPSGGRSLGLDSEGNIYAGGTDGGYLAVKKFRPDGTPVFARRFQASALATPGPGVVTPSGAVWLFGRTAAPDFPTRNALQPCGSSLAPPAGTAGRPSTSEDNVVAVVDSEGRVSYSSMTTLFVRAAALARDGRIWAAASSVAWGADAPALRMRLLRFDPERIPPDRTAPSCLVHGGTLAASRISPGALMTIHGSNLGPAEGVSFDAAEGRAPFELAGASVTVDGVPSPVIYAQEAQLNFMAPWGLRTDGDSVRVCVTAASGTGCLDGVTWAAAPGAFRNREGASVAVNEDGTPNTSGNPAPKGSVVSVFFTGTGPLSGPFDDGAVAGAGTPPLAATVQASFAPEYFGCIRWLPCPPPPSPIPAEVVSAGPAPGMLAGVTRVDIRIPQQAPAGSYRSFTVSFALPGKGAAGAQGQIAIRP